MDLLLRNFYVYKKMLAVAVDDSYSIPSIVVTEKRPVGLWDELGENVVVGLFVAGRQLCLYIDHRIVQVSSEVTSEYSRTGDDRSLKLGFNGEHFFLSYNSDREPMSSMISSEDEEDADFGLWLHNVLTTKGRLSRILDHWEHGLQY